MNKKRHQGKSSHTDFAISRKVYWYLLQRWGDHRGCKDWAIPSWKGCNVHFKMWVHDLKTPAREHPLLQSAAGISSDNHLPFFSSPRFLLSCNHCNFAVRKKYKSWGLITQLQKKGQKKEKIAGV